MDIKPIEYKVWGEPPTLHRTEFCEVANVVIQFKTKDLCSKEDPLGKKTVTEVKHRIETHPHLMRRLSMIREYALRNYDVVQDNPALIKLIDLTILEGTHVQ